MIRTLCVILIAASAIAGESPVEINDFSPGLVTSVNMERVPLGGGVIVHDFDLTLEPGALRPRKGYDEVVTFWDADSILWNGVFTYRTASKDNYALVAIDSVSVGYGRIYIGDENSLDFSMFDSVMVVPYQDSCDLLISHGFCLKVGVTTDYDQTAAQAAAVFYDTLAVEYIVDSIVSEINGGVHSDELTAYDLGDSCLIVEDGDGSGVVITAISQNGFTQGQCSNLVEAPNKCVDVSLVGGLQSGVTALSTAIPATGRLSWAQFDDIVYISNGVTKGRIYDGHKVAEFPTGTPGAASIVPTTSAGTLDGIYRYAIRHSVVNATVGDSTWKTLLGAVSSPVVVDSGQAMLYNFPPPSMVISGQRDTCWQYIYRTDGDSRKNEEHDTLWLIDSVYTDSANYTTATYIDTTSDATMRATGVFIVTGGMVDSLRYRQKDVSGNNDFLMPLSCGAPAIVNTSSDADTGIWKGIGTEWRDYAGWSWVCTFVDTINGVPSDTGRSIYMYQETAPSSMSDVTGTSFARDSCERIQIALPRCEGDDIVCNLYRGVVQPMIADGFAINLGQWGFSWWLIERWAVLGYYLVGSYTPGDTIWDDTPYSTLVENPTYERNAVQELIVDMTVIDDRLVTTDGRGIIVSNSKDSQIVFSLFSEVFVDPDDGDEVVSIFQQRSGTIKAMKRNRSFTISPSSDGDWTARELSSNYGCLATRSVARSPIGDYFLSRDGIREEAEGRYYAGAYDKNLLSAQLDNFENIPAASLRGAYATYFEGKYILTVPDWDTSYVMFEAQGPNGNIVRSFGTWSLRMSASALYSTTGTPDSLIFSIPGGRTINLYGSPYRDAGAPINARWRSGALFKFDRYNYEVSSLDLFAHCADTTDTAMVVSFYDYKDSAWGSTPVVRMDSTMHYWFRQSGIPPSYRWQVDLNIDRSYPAGGPLDGPVIVNGLGVNMVRRGRLIAE